jgi:toxin ParE1/3/4
MSKVILSPRAKLDLSDIWDYTLGQWGAEQAEKYVRGLWASMARAASDSTLSVEIDDVRKGYRKFRYGSHVIFYKMTGHGIDVVRILHQKMDFDRYMA